MQKLNFRNGVLIILFALSYFVSTAQIEFNDSDSGELFSDCPLLKKNCHGKKKWSDGTFYEGDFRFGKPHGKGKITYPDQVTFEGEFEKGYPHGFGICTYQDGSEYEGHWWQGFKEGQGTYKFPGGHEYSGEFSEDKINGKGKIKFATGESYNGGWKNGLAEGDGIFTRRDGSQFIGSSKAGKRYDEGMIVWQSGDTLKGFWEDGKLVEEATYYFADGSKMVSFWKEGEMTDEVFYMTPNQENIICTTGDLVEKILENDPTLLASVENNLQLAFYGIAMEYQAMGEYDRAEQHLDIAYEFIDPNKDSSIYQMVASLSVNLQMEKIAAAQRTPEMVSSSLFFRF